MIINCGGLVCAPMSFIPNAMNTAKLPYGNCVCVVCVEENTIRQMASGRTQRNQNAIIIIIKCEQYAHFFPILPEIIAVRLRLRLSRRMSSHIEH